MERYRLSSKPTAFRKMQQLEREEILKRNKLGKYGWA